MASCSTTTSTSATHRMPPCSSRPSNASRERAGECPQAVTADRGYGETAVGEQLSELGVRNVVLPTKGKPSASRRAVEIEPQFQSW